MLVLSREAIRQIVTMEQAMDAVATAFVQLTNRQADVPLRAHVSVPPADGLSLIMPAYLGGTGALGAKLLTLFPYNPARYGLPTITALVLLFDSSNGLPLALLDGGYLTALRTGAASGVATRVMARNDAHVLALFGAGAQALHQVWAACTARPIERVWIVNRTLEHAERLAVELHAFGSPIPADVRIAPNGRTALAEAGIVCCATASPVPVFSDTDVRPGTHINGIGSYRPDMREVPAATVARSRVVVDQREAAWAEAGDLIAPRDQSVITNQHIVADLGEVLLGRAAARTDDSQITFFKSVGNAVQDVAVAQLAYERARAMGLGTVVSLGEKQ